MIDNARFPIGKYSAPEAFTDSYIKSQIEIIKEFPKLLKKEVESLSDVQLDTPYRADGWTIRQVVHHCADSHMNSLIRFKLALTEDSPTIKPYMEDRWAELVDSKKYPIAPSLQLIEGLHNRWGALLDNITVEQLERTFVHPEHGKSFSLKENIGIYAWHCSHHLAHITELKKRMSW